MTPDLHPVGPELARRNRMIISVRTGWPDDALETCERLDREHPGWSVWWRRAGDRHSSPVFTAARGDVAVCAETPEGLVERMEAAPQRAALWWQRNRCCWPESWDR